MRALFILALAGATSLGAYAVGITKLRLSTLCLRLAAGKMLEAVGTTVMFLAVNLTVAVVVVLTVRAWTGTFVSAYVVDDAAWVGLSLLQGMTFHWWRQLSRKDR